MSISIALRAPRLGQGETFSSLRRNANFRLYWTGSFVSNFGTWMQSVAQGYLVYQLTGSTFMLGMVGFAQSVPFLFFALFGGVLADRFERRRLMVVTQSALMLLAFLLAYLTLSGRVTVWMVLAIALANGVVNAFNVPVRQSIISDLVAREDLSNAIAMNSTQVQLSRVTGPALAGIMLAATGAGWCFFVNAVSFLAVIWTLLVMDVPPLAATARRSALFAMGFASMSYTTLNQGFLQRRVDDQMRGRVLSLLSMAWFGLQPFGSMETGTLASLSSPQLALAVGGAICVAAALFVLARWPS